MATKDELKERYQMDDIVWEYSKRDSFPFNISLRTIIYTCLGLVTIALTLPIGNGPLALVQDSHFLKCVVSTLVISSVAYYITD